jgi:hypothetical protein
MYLQNLADCILENADFGISAHRMQEEIKPDLWKHANRRTTPRIAELSSRYEFLEQYWEA